MSGFVLLIELDILRKSAHGVFLELVARTIGSKAGRFPEDADQASCVARLMPSLAMAAEAIGVGLFRVWNRLHAQ
jgi:hypothetical protein